MNVVEISFQLKCGRSIRLWPQNRNTCFTILFGLQEFINTVSNEVSRNFQIEGLEKERTLFGMDVRDVVSKAPIE